MEIVCIKNENEIRRIDLNRILAVTVEDYLCSFYIKNEENFTCTKSLKEVILELPDFFVRINRNCIVNKNRVKSVNFNERIITLSNDLTFTISARNLKLLKDNLISKAK
ncbi:hypothetical protein FACS189455_1900 [Bacteroidia bacterium]|nr:hypothetical protein FACS189455_1900 [Bacteroidia bacterium]